MYFLDNIQLSYSSLFALLLPVLVWTLLWYRKNDAKRLPPMPPGKLPFIGHLLQIPPDHEWMKYCQWTEQLGSDIICYKVLGSHIIVLNSSQAVSELFEGRASIYSDRPPLLALRHIVGFDWLYGLIPYGKQFFEVRKAANHHLHSTSILRHRPMQTVAVRRMLKDLVAEPDSYVEHFRRMAGHIVLGVAYGIEPSGGYLRAVFHAVEALNLGLSPIALLHDMFPILMRLPDWFPLLRFKRNAERLAPHVIALPEIALNETRKAMKEGKEQTNIAASMLVDGTLPDDIIRSVTGSLYLAGTETTVAILVNFFLAMIKYPEVQTKAQAEIDAVVGNGRLPDFRDEGNLPYVSALVKEVYRWRVVTPQATPHCLIEDDYYREFYLPKGSVVIGNTYAILHDPVAFPDPHVFRPERYLDPSTRAPDGIFGYGGRACPGRFLARSNTWLAVANMLAAFHIEKAANEHGDLIDPDDRSETAGTVVFPLPFKCKIVPRSEAAAALIDASVSDE